MVTDLQTIHTIESSYEYRLEQARVALAQAQENLVALLTEKRAPADYAPSAPSRRTHHQSPYAIGPASPSEFVTLHAHLSTGEERPLLVPVHLPLEILVHPDFRDGYEYNYETDDEEVDEQWTVTQLVNHIYATLTDDTYHRDLETDEVSPGFLPWQVGWVLCDLTRLAEADRTLALTGLAHLCFLLPLLIVDHSISLLGCERSMAGRLHAHTVSEYRGRIHDYRKQGKSFIEAEQLALAISRPEQEVLAC